MNTLEIATAFTALLREGKHEEAAKQFNSPDIVSIESDEEGASVRFEGAEAVAAKAKEWMEKNDVQNVEIEGPFVNGDKFMVEFDMEVTDKESGEAMEMEEIALYTVRDGKIVEEAFFSEHGDEEDEEDETAEADEDEDEPGVHRQG